ncbi:hypothetical protein I7I53_03637 [Histoplasma capsulatum var. duboisii H88]|uniref:Uncharacterized protein n=1 Tax=Ajellomyces capsulatus (strain H88) TaxID=544711 RepID=A0A8A1LTE8_AJEC8|nr:hypothetical protein I7I53_03637 [Histoplasma capsulatum var. duboisii H88]
MYHVGLQKHTPRKGTIHSWPLKKNLVDSLFLGHPPGCGLTCAHTPFSDSDCARRERGGERWPSWLACGEKLTRKRGLAQPMQVKRCPGWGGGIICFVLSLWMCPIHSFQPSRYLCVCA